ncbi:hypothetical protein BD410DRAFT_170053 [Rickenella mellea]|uniref:3-hydroxyacyl-CoA dehydrogenase n=1 Tax=Rickenella mellea TaxID=50990 RepID=A0A4Y7Q7G2_9AGAM|nr:hypothetical protein BD410DRAFT_170053 [Rickenella mellea]
MGAGIVQVAAHNGFKVVLCDVSEKALDTGRGIIQKSVARIAKKSHPADEGAQHAFVASVFDNITTTTDAKEAVRESDLVIEAIVENLKVKKELFERLDGMARPRCLFATNTSSLSVKEIASSTSEDRRTRFGGLHFFNPVPQMKLVEVVRTDDTSAETYQSLMEVCAKMQKHAVTCKDTPGFIVNRLLIPYMAEAIRMLERGDATAEDIDAAMRLGAGYPMGPFELTDFVGLDTTKHILDGWRDKVKDGVKSIPAELVEESEMLSRKVSEGKMGRKSGEGFFKY